MTKPTYKETILHVDMDCFFVSVERLFDPTLKGVPVVSGHNSKRSVVSSASYEARALGVHSAMPIATALRLIPDLRIVSDHFHEYGRFSKQVFTILESFTPHVEPVSIDEAYLDVSSATNLFGSPKSIAETIKMTVEDQTGLPVSIGIATNKLLAKLASNEAKPNGIYLIPHDQIDSHILNLPLGKLHGIGPKMVNKLESYHIHTVSDARRLNLTTLSELLGESAGQHIYQAIYGKDDRVVQDTREARKSMSKEHTFLEDIADIQVLKRTLLAISEELAQSLRQKRLLSLSVSIKIRYANLKIITRTQTLPRLINDSNTIYKTASMLLDKLNLQRVRVRLVGISLGGLANDLTPVQHSLFEDLRWEHLDKAADNARAKFGSGKITRGALLQPPEPEDKNKDL